MALSACGGGGSSGGSQPQSTFPSAPAVGSSPPASAPSPAASVPAAPSAPPATAPPVTPPVPVPSASVPPPAPAPAGNAATHTVFVATAAGQIDVFSYAQSAGTVTSVRTIDAVDTTAGVISSLAADAAGNVYAAYLGPPGKVTRWAPAAGSVPAVLNFAGTHKINSVRVDASGQIYTGTDTVNVYAAGAVGGAAPVRTITVPFSQSSGNVFVNGFDAQGNLYVSSSTALTDFINVYAPGAVGTAPALRTISIDTAHFNLNLTSGAVDRNGNVYFSTNGPDGVMVFAATSSLANATPTRNLTGVATTLVTPTGVAVDAAGNLYAANFGSNQVTIYGPTANGNVAAAQTIGGANVQAPEAVVVGP